MRPLGMIILLDELLDEPVEMPVVEGYYVVEQRAAQSTEDAFDEGILPWTSMGGADLLESTLLQDVDALIAAYAAGRKPVPENVQGWKPEQIELFLKKLPTKISAQDCRAFQELFGLKECRNNNHLVADYCTAIRSGCEEALAGVEKILSTVGRMLYLKPLYRALIETSWSKPKARTLFEHNRAAYHPIAAGGIERILKEAGL